MYIYIHIYIYICIYMYMYMEINAVIFTAVSDSSPRRRSPPPVRDQR